MTQYVLRPSINPRERLLTFGVGGTGKSAALLRIARKCPTDTFYVLDTDYGNYDRLLATEFSDLDNVRVYVVDEWDEYTEHVKEIQAEMQRDDWLGIDMMTQSWQAVQGWFTNQVFNSDIAEYFMEVRKKKAEADQGKKSLGAFDGWMDWPVINKVYFKFYNQLLKTPGHLYMAAEQDATSSDDDKEVKAAFGPYGVKPRGQKRLGHVASSVIWLTKSRSGGSGHWAMTTIKDRGRVEVEDEIVKDFATDYLMKIAGWRPKPVG